MARSKKIFSKIACENLRLKQTLDRLKIYRDELTPAQAELVESFRKQLRTRPLTERQIDTLFSIADSLEPDQELLIRQKY